MVNMGRTMRYLTRGSEVNVVRYLISWGRWKRERGGGGSGWLGCDVREGGGTYFDHVDALEELSRDDMINCVLRFRYTDEIRWLTSMMAIPQYYVTRDETLISLPTSPAYCGLP